MVNGQISIAKLDTRTVTEKISEWKQAKEFCEKIPHLEKDQKIAFIKNSNLETEIQQKAINLIEKLNDDFKLIESNSLDNLISAGQRKINLVGKFIDDYELVKVLGYGGMSTVYLAKRSYADIQKYVALKILSPYATADKHLELFNREQQSLARLNHNNIVSLHHGGKTEDGTNYLVMDYIKEASDIIQYSKDKNLCLADKIELIRTVAHAISYAHNKSIIHRDLKSANILIDNNGEVKIVDFGIALFAKDSKSAHSTQVFTIDIASPEQIFGEKIDLRTDIFSLGALLLQLLTDQLPTPKTKPNQYDPINVRKHVNLLLNTSTLNTDLKKIIQTAMHIDVDKRYNSMDDFAKDLDNFLQHKPVIANSDSTIYRTKKFLQRNPISSVLFTIVLMASLFAIITINRNISKRQHVEEKNTRSLAIIDALFAQADPFIAKKNTNEIIKLLESIKDGQKQLLDSDPEFKYEFYLKLAFVYDTNSLYSQALESEKTALQTLITFANPDDQRILDREAEILNLLHAVGHFKQAINQGLIFLNKLKNKPNSPPQLTLVTYILLSKSYSALSQYAKATEIGEIAKKHIRQYPTSNLEQQAYMYNSMAVVQRSLGNLPIASKYYNQAIMLLRNIKGKEKKLATLLTNYAVFKGRSGDFKTSEKLFLEGIDIIKSVDPKHPALAATYLQYATLLSITNRIDEAKTIVENAKKIFIESGNKLQLAKTYSRLANFSLTQNNIKAVMQNLILEKQLIVDTYEIDHRESLYLYNLSLWALMLKPYQKYAHKLINFLDETDYVHSVNSSEYAIYQVQKALLNHQVITNNQRFSIFSQYLYGDHLNTDNQKISWLQDHIDHSDKYPALVKAFLHIWLLDLIPDENKYQSYCLDSSNWVDTVRLALKIDLMKQCIKIANKYNYETPIKFTQAVASINKQLKDNEETVENFVAELTKNHH